ncbi:YgjP-like metallopeptidase domain-containing protein [Herpetosiphon gulosus]|uniref:YgjP-like metallopeptidase domain-containing protein n=1 Tax=Herpetosiphon gulosus TaxID=1973496 RepID=UPI0031E73CB5
MEGLALILASYVLCELVHMLEPHHQQPFWERLGRAMADYLARKQWLQIYDGGL